MLAQVCFWVCTYVCKCVFVCAACAAVGGGLFIMLRVSPPAKPLLSQHRAPAAPALVLLPYLRPMGAPVAYSAPQGQNAGAPTETQTTITTSSTRELLLIHMEEHEENPWVYF